MRWIAGLLAALVLAMSLAMAQEANGQANVTAEGKISVFGLRLRQIGQAFGDFAFQVKKILTFDERAKVELLKERNAEMKARQEAWLETKARALAQFESGNMTAEEKKEVISMLQAEHEAMIKDHLRLTAEIREIQLNAKAKGKAELEVKAGAEAEEMEDSGLAEGLRISEDFGTSVKVTGNVALSADASSTLKQLVSSFSGAESRTELKLKAEKQNGEVEMEANAEGSLTAGQQSLWTELQNEINVLVGASGGEIEIEIEHELVSEAEMNITAEAARAIVQQKLGFETSEVRTEIKDNATFFVVTGAETETAGSFELEKGFEVWVKADTGLITSVDLDTHIEAAVSGSAAVKGSAIGDETKMKVKASLG